MRDDDKTKENPEATDAEQPDAKSEDAAPSTKNPQIKKSTGLGDALKSLLSNVLFWIIIGVFIIAIVAILLLNRDTKGTVLAVERQVAKDIKFETFYYYEIPNLTVNIVGGPREPMYLKLSVHLKVDNKSLQEFLTQLRPVIEDHVMTYLRSLRYDDLQGSEGLERIRSELTTRINQLTQPVQVHQVLITNILMQ